MDSTTEIQPPILRVRQNAWLKVLAIAVDFYILLLAALLLTDNPNLFQILVMVGSFTVPVAYVAFFLRAQVFKPNDIANGRTGFHVWRAARDHSRFSCGTIFLSVTWILSLF